MTASGTRSWWGWGTTDRALPDEECVAFGSMLPGLPDRPRAVPRVEDLSLPVPRIDPPAGLPITTAPDVRAAHTYGKAYRDVLRALRGELANAPDLVAFPADESQITDLLDWASAENVAVIPRGRPSRANANSRRVVTCGRPPANGQ